MNKKYIVYSLPILMIGLVVAGAFYFQFSDNFNVSKSIIGTGFTTDDLGDVYDGDVVLGSERTLQNNADSERDVLITEDSGLSVDVEYVSTTTLTEKTVDFSLDVWAIPTSPDEVGIQYTLIGDDFSAEVTSGEKDGYVLIYYKDNSDRFNSPAEAMLVSSGLGNLPYGTDANAGEYDYSVEYPTTPHGAKIWYVPLDAINGDNTLDWSRADEFRYETELIQYNQDGEITIYPGQVLDLTPVYNIQKYAEGSKTITTLVE